jgi:putative acetyltransferase
LPDLPDRFGLSKLVTFRRGLHLRLVRPCAFSSKRQFDMKIRQERPEDAGVIRQLTYDAFKPMPYSNGGDEARIPNSLRAAGVLTLSLVAEEAGEIIGQITFSPVMINGEAGQFYGLGPVAVSPARQFAGIGSALIREGLAQLEAMGADGCVLLGNPDYYARFGFVSDPGLTYGDFPPGPFQVLVFKGQVPRGKVTFHPSFENA